MALWFVEFTAIFGFSFAAPFLPIYLRHDLGMGSPHDLALWAGVIGGGAGLAMAVASPIWGVIADRRGRKTMLLRAIACGAVSVGLMSFAQTPGQLFALCVVQGASSGTVAAATALIGAETPRRNVGHALGVLGSAVALGSCLGPLLGGLAVGVIGLRLMFVIASLLLSIAILPAIFVVRESARPPRTNATLPSRRALSGLPRLTAVALIVLIGGQSLMQFSSSAAPQLSLLRMLRFDPAHAGTAAGLAFGIAGLGAAVASVSYERVLRRIGYRRFIVDAAGLLAITVAGAAFAGNTVGVVLAVGAGGLVYGGLSPVLYSMIGLEVPRRVQSTIFGISASALSLGAGAGPMLGGLVAAAGGLQAGLLLASAAAALLAAVFWIWAREPQATLREAGELQAAA